MVSRIGANGADITAMYNFTQGTKATPGNELGIFEDLGDIYSQQDLNEFFLTLQPYVCLAKSMNALTIPDEFRLAHTRSWRLSTVPKRPPALLMPDQSRILTSKSRTRSSGRRIRFSSRPMTRTMRTITHLTGS